MKEQTQALEHASVKQYCKALRVPMIGAHFVQLAEQAIKEQRSHIGYLEALLTMESEERDRHAIQQRLRDAKLPRLKTLEEFDFNQARQIPDRKSTRLNSSHLGTSCAAFCLKKMPSNRARSIVSSSASLAAACILAFTLL